MKKITLFFAAIFMAFVLTACFKDKPGVPVDNQDNTSITGEAVSPSATATTEPTPEVTAEPTPEITSEPTPEITAEPTPEITVEPVPEVKTAPTNSELCTAYAQVLSDLAYENELAGDIVFATVDTNNDDVRELLFSESSVNASGVYVCFYDNGKVFTAGPFGCYGGMKYAPETGSIISELNNMDYVTYEVIDIDEKYSAQTVDKFSIEPDSSDNSFHYFRNDVELTHDEFADQFAPLQSLKTRSIGYYDMYWYCWCNDEYDPILERLNQMLEGEEYGRSCNLIIPADEKSKLIGTWTIYSREFDGEELFASDGDLEGTIVVDKNCIVTLYRSNDEIWHKDLDMFFVSDVLSDYMDNTDWYVWLSGDDMNGDEFYMNVTPDGQLCMNYVNTENDEYYISAWSYYDRVSD